MTHKALPRWMAIPIDWKRKDLERCSPLISILGGDVFVLQITNVTHNDTGLYVCEVNTDPPLRSFHRLSVLTDTLVAPAPHPASDEHTYVYCI